MIHFLFMKIKIIQNSNVFMEFDKLIFEMNENITEFFYKSKLINVQNIH